MDQPDARVRQVGHLVHVHPALPGQLQAADASLYVVAVPDVAPSLAKLAKLASDSGGWAVTASSARSLMPAVDAVGAEIPVLGAGGFHDGRGLVAALAFGADGIAMGTRFLLTQESHVPAVVKDRYTAATVFDTVVTTALDGAPQRVIRTDVVDRLERSPRVRDGLAWLAGRSRRRR